MKNTRFFVAGPPKANSNRGFLQPGLLPVLVILLSGWILLPHTSFAQSVEITPFTGYMFGGSIRGYEGELKIADGQNFGGLLSVGGGGTFVEFMYNYQHSEARLERYGLAGSEKLFDINSNYFQLQALREGGQNEKIRPFGTIGLGAAVFVPDATDYTDQWFFSASLGAGLKVHFNDRIGLRMQGRFLAPLLFSGGGLWCGGGGCSVGVGTYSAILQGDFSAGLIFSFNR